MNGSCTVTQSHGDFEFEEWSIDFEAEATFVHEDRVLYYKDGSGYPGYEGIEDVQFTINSVIDSDGNELDLGDDNYPVSWEEETKKRCESAINSYLDNHDWDYPEPDYPDEED